MTEDARPKPKLVTPSDALDLSDLWLDPGLGDGITETVRHSIPLGKPRDFFRMHPDPAYRRLVEIYKHKTEDAIEEEYFVFAGVPLPTGDMSAKPTPQPKPPETVEAPEADHRGFAHFVVPGRQATRREKCEYFVQDRVQPRQAPSQPTPSSPSMRPKFVGSASARSPI